MGEGVDASRTWHDAERLSAAGRGAAAMELYRALLADRSFAPYAHLRLSIAAQRSGDVREASSHALDAMRKAHKDPELLEMLSKLLLRVGETHAALACANALLDVGASVESMAEVGKMLSDYMLPDAALPLLQRAMVGGMGGSPALQYLVGLNCMYAGELDAAAQMLELSLRGSPEFAPAHWAMTKLDQCAGRGARIDRLKRLLAGAIGQSADAALLWYCLFHELDREGLLAEAWQALDAAMRLRRLQVRFDESAQDALFEEAAKALQQTVCVSDAEMEGPMPIFVVGLPRSGTTVIERALCAQADVASAGELRDLAIQMRWVAQQPGGFHVDADLLRAISAAPPTQLGRRYLEHTQWRARGQAFFTDKWPENYLAIGHILAAMPKARVICVMRNPEDACFSNLKEWFASSYAYSYTQEEVARQYGRYDALLHQVRAIGSARVAFVQYETFVLQPEAAVAALKMRLNLPDRTGPGLSESVATASAVQIRTAVNSRHVGAWRRYADRLSPMCAELEKLGYPHVRRDGA